VRVRIREAGKERENGKEARNLFLPRKRRDDDVGRSKAFLTEESDISGCKDFAIRDSAAAAKKSFREAAKYPHILPFRLLPIAPHIVINLNVLPCFSFQL